MSVRILTGDCRDVLKTLPAESVHCVVTSPPYWGLRDYNIPPSIWGGDEECDHEWGDTIIERATNHTDKRRWQHTRSGRDEEQPTEKRVGWLRSDTPQGKFCQHCGAWAGAHGLEPSFELYVENEVSIFREVRRVLRRDGTLWLNLGDSYAANGGNGAQGSRGQRFDRRHTQENLKSRAEAYGLKPKDLVGVPWRTAFALQADGWWLRQDIIWSKPNPMPESVRDRCTKAHEYLFLLSKSERYYFDAAAIAEPLAYGSVTRLSQDVENQDSSERVPGKTNGAMKAVYKEPYTGQSTKDYASGCAQDASATKARIVDRILSGELVTRNKRSVWEVTTRPFSEAHFATFPPALIEPCIKAGCPEGGTVLDPFGGAGTTGLVADRLQRNSILIELNPAYAAMAENRIRGDAPLFHEGAAA